MFLTHKKMIKTKVLSSKVARKENKVGSGIERHNSTKNSCFSSRQFSMFSHQENKDVSGIKRNEFYAVPKASEKWDEPQILFDNKNTQVKISYIRKIVT